MMKTMMIIAVMTTMTGASTEALAGGIVKTPHILSHSMQLLI